MRDNTGIHAASVWHLSRKPRYSGGSARHSSLGFRRSTRVPATAFVKGFGCRPVVDLYSRGEGRRPKASEEGTRGAGERFAVYGDLIGQRRGRQRRWPASLRA